VTIAIPCYNYGPYLAAAINSALGQTYPDIEIIVIDDGSTDETPTIIAEFGETVRSFRQDNAGVAAARNYAASVAKGEFIMFLDADDELHPIYVQELLGAFCDRREDDTLGFVYSQEQLFGRERRMTWFPKFDPTTLACGDYVNAAALLRSAVLRDASFDPALDCEDWDFFLTLVDHGWTGDLVDLPLLRYRKHNDARSRSDVVQRWHERERALRSSLRAKHPYLPHRPILRRGRMFESYVRP
jgi:glycosyltransferase involved in cell wall biosynthesis